MNWDWVGGFFDGEGSAYLSSQRRRDCTSGFTFRPTLKIAQKNRRVVEEIHRFIGLGQVGSEGKEGRYWAWSVCSARQCLEIIPKLSRHVLLKRRQLALLEEACHLLAESCGRPQTSISRLIDMCEQMRELNGMRNIANRLDLDAARSRVAIVRAINNTRGVHVGGSSGTGSVSTMKVV